MGGSRPGAPSCAVVSSALLPWLTVSEDCPSSPPAQPAAFLNAPGAVSVGPCVCWSLISSLLWASLYDFLLVFIYSSLEGHRKQPGSLCGVFVLAHHWTHKPGTFPLGRAGGSPSHSHLNAMGGYLSHLESSSVGTELHIPRPGYNCVTRGSPALSLAILSVPHSVRGTAGNGALLGTLFHPQHAHRALPRP
jgi:hypothetical protein